MYAGCTKSKQCYASQKRPINQIKQVGRKESNMTSREYSRKMEAKYGENWKQKFVKAGRRGGQNSFVGGFSDKEVASAAGKKSAHLRKRATVQ